MRGVTVRGRRSWVPAAAAATAACLLALVPCAAAVAAATAPPQLAMVQPRLVLPALALAGNASTDVAGDVAVAVRLQGGAGKHVTAALRLLVPGNGSGDGGRAAAWAAADPDELWLEPASLSWRAGEAAGAKSVRLRSAAELPLAAVLEDALYAAAAGGGVAAQPAAAGQPLLRVELASAVGAAIDRQRSSTTLVADAEDEAPAGGGAPAPGDGAPPLFGFVANQAAYPPAANGSDGGAAIPVRLLAGRLDGPATLRFVVAPVPGSAPLPRGRQQLLPSQALSGFLRFEPAGAGGAAQEERLIQLPVAWDRVAPEAEYRLGLQLDAVSGARVQPQPDAVALHVFGSPLGTCPPGAALRQPAAGNGSAAGGAGGASLVSSSDGGFAEEAEFGLVLNGTVIDLSSSLMEANGREYAAMVESDVRSVTLCLRAAAGNPGSVRVVPSAGAARGAVTVLRPAPSGDADAACGCNDSGGEGDEGGGGGSSSSSSSSSSDSLGGGVSASLMSADSGGGAACEYVAWVLPLAAGQNQFAVTLPGQPGAAGPATASPLAGPAPAPAAEATRASAGGAGGQYSLAVVRLADPDHAELQSITVKSSDDSTVVLCGPSQGGERGDAAGRALPLRATLDAGGGAVHAAPAAQPCVPGRLLALDVSQRSRLVSLTPELRRPNVAGVRVEVNGQVLSRGGDVAADRLEDTTAAAQQRSNSSFLPSAFIMGLLPGSRVDAEVVVVAEDGVTARRYPIRFLVVAGAKQQQLSVAAAPAGAGGPAAEGGTGVSERQRGWPLSPALQPMCAVCPAGWAAGAPNSTACHMCPPGTFARSDGSRACLSCGPGTFAYSWGSSYCKNCIEGTHAPTANSSLCLPCPANTTTSKDGQAGCSVPLRPGAYEAPRYAVVVSFWVLLTGVDPEDVVVRAGVNAPPEAIVTTLIRADTARQFNISTDDVAVVSVRQVARRTLGANVTATLGVDVPAGATEEDIAAAMEVQRLSADDSIDMLSSDPDRFFGRTTKTLEVQVESEVAATTESRPGGTNYGLLVGVLVPGVLVLVLGATAATVGCRRSRACATWRGTVGRRLATSRLAPRAVAYSRYSGGSSAGGSATP